MILILSGAGDHHASHVEDRLRERGAPFLRFDPGEFPRAAEISVSYAASGAAGAVLRAGDLRVELDALRAVWYRRPTPPVPHDELAGEPLRTFVQRECSAFVQDLWSSLDCAWLPGPPATVRHASQKAAQLKVAGALGFELPPTLVTNSAADFLDFYARHEGRVVSKVTGTAFTESYGQTFVRFTELVSHRDVAHARSIRYCPMIFQAYVPKRIELRVTVVGRQVFAAEIHSQATNHTRHDWRRYDIASTPHEVHELPAAMERRCVALVERLGLRYGAIDLVLTPDGRYVFLEINPNGQYLWIEHATGLPITEAICDLLAGEARAGAPPEQVSTGSAQGGVA